MKRLLSLAISLALLGLLYWRIDTGALLGVFARSSAGWMAISLAAVVPITVVTAWRFRQLAPQEAGLGLAESTRLILAASVLNMLLPSKMGDLAKAYFMQRRGILDGSRAVSLVLFEKSCDLLSLLVWCAFGLAAVPRKEALFWALTAAVVGGTAAIGALLFSRRVAEGLLGGAERLAARTPGLGRLAAAAERLRFAWGEMQAAVRADRRRAGRVAATSLFLWLLHLLQIWLFIRALRADAPFLATLALAPLAILAGLLPLTFAGVGTRDAALVLLFQPYFGPPTAAALGLLCTSRYLLPALGGLPFLSGYLARPEGLPASRKGAPPRGTKRR